MVATTDRAGVIAPGYSKRPANSRRGGYSRIQFVRITPNSPHRGVGRACGVGRDLGIALGVAVGVAVGVAEGVGVGVAVGVGVGVGVAVGVGVGVGVAVGVGVGVGVPPPPGAWISTFIGEPVLKKPTVASVVFGA
jgi:hypothetical protein